MWHTTKFEITCDRRTGAEFARFRYCCQLHLACRKKQARLRGREAGKIVILGNEERKELQSRHIRCFKLLSPPQLGSFDFLLRLSSVAGQLARRHRTYSFASASTVFRTHSWHFKHFIVTLTHAIDVPSMLLSSASFCNSSTAFTNSVL